MTFKADWEKSQTRHQLPAGIIEQMINSVYPGKTVESSKIICCSFPVIHWHNDMPSIADTSKSFWHQVWGVRAKLSDIKIMYMDFSAI
ncbi:MAG: hypothetical protein WBJ81_00125 [Rickettsiales bacterium]